MDPLSIVASAIGVFQAADRLTALLGNIKPLLNAQNDITSLLSEVRILRDTLERLQEAVTYKDDGIFLCRTSLLEPIEACLLHISGLEGVISDCCKLKDNSDEPILVDVSRIAWVRKKGEMERIKHRLRDALASLQVALSCINL